MYLVFVNRPKDLTMIVLMFLYMSIFIGLGDMIGGYDRYIYGEMFDSIADEMRGNKNLTRLFYFIDGKEYGYFAWEILVSLFTRNRYIFILVTILATYLLYFNAFKKYITNYPLACIVFMGFLFYFSMTYLRQTFAIGIAWQGIQYIWQRKPIKFFLIIALAISFHTSTAIFAIMYFIPRRKYSTANIATILLLCLIIGATPLPQYFLASANDFADKGGEGYTNELQGFRIEYVLETIFLMTIVFTHYRKIDRSPQTLTFLNMTVVFCAVMLFFMRFGQGGRFGWPFFFGIFYILPYIANLRGSASWVRPFVIVVCFALFARITVSWNTLNIPYKTFLTNGEPSGNGDIYHKYEYDYNYTTDKLYR